MKKLEAGGFLSGYLPHHRTRFRKGITERLEMRDTVIL
jgi:hypothetical protein